jgi:hypothetical protein
MTAEEIIWIWISAIITNVVVSYVFKKTYAYTIIERLLVGSASGYALMLNLRSIQTSGIAPLMAGRYTLIIAFILFILLWSRFIPDISWLARYPTSILIGIGLGIALATGVSGQVLGLSVATFNDVLKAKDAFSMFNALVIVIGTLSSLWYFIYTKEHTGYWGYFVRLGVLYMYVLFGLTFAGQYLASGMERTILAFEYMIRAPLRSLGFPI